MEHATAARSNEAHDNGHKTAKMHTSISQVVTSEIWLTASGTPHRNENMICRDQHCSAVL